jgi:hypothetical protein
MGAAVKPLRTGASRFNSGPRKRKTSSPLDKAKGHEVIWSQVAGVFEAMRPFQGAVFVYVIGEPDDGMLKIGVSKDPIARLRTMQTGNPRRLRLEYVLAGSMQLEKLMHELWESHAIVSARNVGKDNVAPGTEWFTPDARETLLPIVADAAQRQIDYLAQQTGNVHAEDLERLIREAHADSGRVIHKRDETLLLGQTVGIVVQGRPSRI